MHLPPGLTHAEIASLLGCCESAIGHWLANRRQPRPEAVRLLEVLAQLEWQAPALWDSIVAPHRKPQPKIVHITRPLPPPVSIYKPMARVPVYTLAKFEAGEYDDLYATMDDDEYERWYAALR